MRNGVPESARESSTPAGLNRMVRTMLQRILRPLGVVLASLATTALLPAQQASVAPAQQAPAVKRHESPQHAFIWKVEKEGLATSYLFGTMHGPDPRFTKFNDTVKMAFKQADAVYTELDMTVMTSPKAQELIMEIGMLKNGQKLSAMLSEESLSKLEKVLGQYGMPVAVVDNMRPFLASMTIEQFALATHMGQGEALDQKIWNAAVKAKKEVGGVETLEEQFSAISVLTDEEATQALVKQLDLAIEDMESGRVRLMEMAEHYLSGNTKTFLEFINETSDPEDPIEAKFMEALLDKRNVVMADRSADLMTKHPKKSYVFVFGTLHFIGRNTVGELLEKKGFKVTRLTAPPKVKDKVKAKAKSATAGR